MAKSLPLVYAVNRIPTDIDVDAVALAVAKVDGKPTLLNAGLPQELADQLSELLSPLNVTGSRDQVVRVPATGAWKAKVLILSGIGTLEQGEEPNAEALRLAAGAVAARTEQLNTLAFAFPTPDVLSAAATAEGALLGGYRYNGYRTQREENSEGAAPAGPTSWDIGFESAAIITPVASAKNIKAAFEQAEIIAHSTNTARTLVNQAPSTLYPNAFAEQVKEAAKALPLKVSVWDEKKLEKDGFGGILGVGKGSTHAPRLVKIEYTPAKALKNFALIGKGITFDSGGISLKPSLNMRAMKSDMAGAASVLGGLLAAAKLKLPVAVTGWLAIAENMPGGNAQKPSDVLTVFGGKTVEVNNTDAEGRLVMADALVAASNEHPDAIVDIATLTGAQLVALGVRTAGVMGEEQLSQEIVSAANSVGEPMWHMPMPEHLRSSLDSAVADISNQGDRHGGMLTAALFLREFVGKNDDGAIPWAHIDIAGPSFNEGKPFGFTPGEATGFGTRTLIALLEAQK